MNNSIKPKALVFFQYLPPWRIDVFNEMAKYYQLTIAFTNADVQGFTYNREDLLNRLHPEIKPIFLRKGFKIGQRPIRFGIFKLIKSVRPVIIFSHEYTPTSILTALCRKIGLCQYRYIITTSDNLGIAEAVGGLKYFFRSFVLNNSDGIVVYSERVRTFYQNLFPNLRVEICPNIQNPKALWAYKTYFPQLVNEYRGKFNLSQSKVLLYTGRLERVKGLDLLLTAFSKSDYKGVKLVLVGEGGEKENLVKMCRELRIESNVVFAGFYSGAELYAWYQLADGYILPSRFEPFGAVVNEALVFGCPVMASKYIGATDFIDNTNGMLFDSLNQNEFIEKLNKFYLKLGENNKMDRKNLMRVSFDKYVKVFYEVNN